MLGLWLALFGWFFSKIKFADFQWSSKGVPQLQKNALSSTLRLPNRDIIKKWSFLGQADGKGWPRPSLRWGWGAVHLSLCNRVFSLLELILFVCYMFCYPPVLPLSSHPSLSSSMSSTSRCRLQRPVQTNRISTLTSLSFVRSFFTSRTVARCEHYCLYIHCLADWIENWNSSQSETQFYASGSAFEFSNTNMRERATSETENLYFKLTLTQYIRHQLSFEWNSFFFNQKGLVVDFIKSGWQKNWTGIGICERDSGKRILWKLIWVAWRDLDLKYW